MTAPKETVKKNQDTTKVSKKTDQITGKLSGSPWFVKVDPPLFLQIFRLEVFLGFDHIDSGFAASLCSRDPWTKNIHEERWYFFWMAKWCVSKNAIQKCQFTPILLLGFLDSQDFVSFFPGVQDWNLPGFEGMKNSAVIFVKTRAPWQTTLQIYIDLPYK